jgi:membrane-associated phospholipid phosphatase
VIMTIIAATPRLVVGAHWFTDNIVGGLGFSLIGFGLLLVSGLYAFGVTRLEGYCLLFEKRFGIRFLEDNQAQAGPPVAEVTAT